MRFLRRPLLVLGAACTLVVSLTGQTVRVLSVSGDATIQLPGEDAPRAVRKGDTIVVGTRIVTGDGARVILTPLPGVNSIIAPKSEVVIESVSSPAPGASRPVHSAVLDLKSGAVTTDLKSSPGVELDYGVRTARGLAGARGTTYTVGINAAGIQTIVVADGVITLNLADGRVVSLVPGQVSITRTDGSTQAVTSASDLSTGDQAIAENWVQVTLEALLEAIEQGVEIDPAALEDAVRAARELGIEIDADMQNRIDRARDTLAELRQAAFDLLNSGNTLNNSNSEFVTETANEAIHDQDAYALALAAYLDSLSESRRAAFLALPEDVQRLLVTVNESTYTAYALDPFDEGQSRPADAIRYAGRLPASLRPVFFESSGSVQYFLVSHPTDTGLRDYALTPGPDSELPDYSLLVFFRPLSAGQRGAFRALPQSLQYGLAYAEDTALTNYALATGRTQAEVGYALSLHSGGRLGAFLALSQTLQQKLVAADDPALTAYALDTARDPALIGFAADLSPSRRAAFFALSDSTQSLLASKAADTALLAFALDSARSETEIGFFANLATDKRTTFLALLPAQQSALASIDDPALTDYVLAPGRDGAAIDYALDLTSERRGLYLSFTAAAQEALVANPGDLELDAFAYATDESGAALHSSAAIVFFAGIDAEDRELFSARPVSLQDVAAGDASFAVLLLARDPETSGPLYSDASLVHYLQLSPSARAAFLAFPSDIREQLATLAKPGLTAALGDPKTFGEPPTLSELRRNLAALLALSPENQALFERFAGGPTYAGLDFAPSPYDWTDAAWTRTREAFEALSPTQQNRVIELRAIEGLFDYSGSFLQLALEDYDNTLSSADRARILAAGWGRYFAEFFADETTRSLFAEIADFSAAEIAAIGELGLSPSAFASGSRSLEVALVEGGPISPSEGNYNSARQKLGDLAALSPTDRATLAALGLGDSILNVYGYGYYDEDNNYIHPDYAQTLQNGLAFARSLHPDDLADVRALGLGHDLFTYPADGTIYYEGLTARQHLAQVLELYRSLGPTEAELVRDLGLFATSIHDERLNSEDVAYALSVLGGVSANTLDYLAFVRDEVPVLDLVLGSGGYESYNYSSFYSIEAIDELLGSLDEAEFATLRELRPGRSILVGSYGDGGILSSEELKFTLGLVASFDDTQRRTLNELGITRPGNERKGLFLAAIEGELDHPDRGLGLRRLLEAYGELDPTLRVSTRQISPWSEYRDYAGPSFFFASDDGYDHTTYSVSFASPGDLHVGATRRLALFRHSSWDSITFNVPAGKDVFLRASSVIDLDNVTFAAQVRAITMEAVTINLADLDFPEGSVVSLNSRDGGTGTDNKYPNFGYSEVGRVNFIRGVSYGGAGMTDEASFDSYSRGNIVIGTLRNRAALPAYTPPSGGILPPSN
jgi:hypothetical protein